MFQHCLKNLDVLFVDYQDESALTTSSKSFQIDWSLQRNTKTLQQLNVVHVATTALYIDQCRMQLDDIEQHWQTLERHTAEIEVRQSAIRLLQRRKYLQRRINQRYIGNDLELRECRVERQKTSNRITNNNTMCCVWTRRVFVRQKQWQEEKV